MSFEAPARTWTVIKDGSGDFTRIVDAMAAIADGDTVEIHPGRFGGFQQISLPGQSGPASAFVTKNDITIRGTDRDAVIIGPATSNWSGYWPKGIVTDIGTTGLRLENLTIENLREGCYWVGAASISNVLIRGNDYGLVALTGGGLVVEGCEFRENNDGMFASPPTQSSLRVTDSVFGDLGFGLRMQFVNTELTDLRFESGGGVLLLGGTMATMTRCVADGTTGAAVVVGQGANLELSDSSFHGGSVGVWLDTFDSDFEANGVSIAGMTLVCLYVDRSRAMKFQYGDLLPASGHAVRITPQGSDCDPCTIDVRNNHWGVETAEEIDELILDVNDGVPEVTLLAIYEPFLLQSVPTRPHSFGELRALFGQR